MHENKCPKCDADIEPDYPCPGDHGAHLAFSWACGSRGAKYGDDRFDFFEALPCLRRQSAKWEQMYLEEWKAGEDARAENAKLREILAKVVLAVQQLQPPDSLIPGDEVAVVEWIVREAIKANATAKADALREVRLAVARVKAKGLTENDEIVGQQDMKDRILGELRRLTAEAEKESGE